MAEPQLMPGYAFLRPETELTTRLCFVDFDGDAGVVALQNGEDVTSKVGKTLTLSAVAFL